MDFHSYKRSSARLQELERVLTSLRRDNVPPGHISVLFMKTPRREEDTHLGPLWKPIRFW